MDDSQAAAVLYYDTCDDFLLDIGSQLEKVLNPSVPVTPEKILGGASPLLPVLHLVITYGPIAGPAAAIFFKGVLSKAGEEFTSMIKDKLTRHKNNKLVRFIIVVNSKEITVNGRVKFDDYETITKALNSTPLMIDDAYQRKLINPDQLPIMALEN